MSAMRILLVLILLVCSGAASALETARALAASGAPRLALARVEQVQPREVNAPRWPEWEALRITLLVAVGRNADALQRANGLPAGMPPPLLRECLLAAARAAIATGQGAVARRHAARVLWQLEPAAQETRAARLLVIESYIAERQGEPAFRAMLRFQQDYAPLDSATAGRFVEWLLTVGMEKQAVNWLASLDDAGYVKLLLRLRTGLADPDSVEKQARAALAKGGGAGYWRVLAEVAQRRKDAALRVEALEHLVNADEETAAGKPAELASELWESYLAGAREAANRNQMLTGDDAAWADYAGRQTASNPPVARAFFAHLALRGRERETRFNSQLQLAYSLQQSRLERTALRLFQALNADESGIDGQARYLIGAMAERAHQPAVAARYWKGIAAPPGVNAAEWQARVAAAYWRAGEGDAAASTLRALLGPGKPLPAEAARPLAALAQEMIAAGKTETADEILRGLLPGSDAKQQRDILYTLGKAAEQAARHQAAADYYLRSALLADGKPDALAVQARLAAGLNLVQAGFRDDARAQFQWLLKNTTDPAQLAIAKRELAVP
jgi:hypothetical protein